jgi:hypothetical protein
MDGHGPTLYHAARRGESTPRGAGAGCRTLRAAFGSTTRLRGSRSAPRAGEGWIVVDGAAIARRCRRGGPGLSAQTCTPPGGGDRPSTRGSRAEGRLRGLPPRRRGRGRGTLPHRVKAPACWRRQHRPRARHAQCH